jgi:hypothetical protein
MTTKDPEEQLVIRGIPWSVELISDRVFVASVMFRRTLFKIFFVRHFSGQAVFLCLDTK